MAVPDDVTGAAAKPEGVLRVRFANNYVHHFNADTYTYCESEGVYDLKRDGKIIASVRVDNILFVEVVNV